MSVDHFISFACRTATSVPKPVTLNPPVESGPTHKQIVKIYRRAMTSVLCLVQIWRWGGRGLCKRLPCLQRRRRRESLSLGEIPSVWRGRPGWRRRRVPHVISLSRRSMRIRLRLQAVDAARGHASICIIRLRLRTLANCNWRRSLQEGLGVWGGGRKGAFGAKRGEGAPWGRLVRGWRLGGGAGGRRRGWKGV